MHLHLYLYQSCNDLYLYHSLDDCSPGGCQYDWETTGHFPNECFPHWNSWPATNQQASPTHHSTEGNDGKKSLIFLFPTFSFCICICFHVCICILSVYTARESSRHYHKSTEGKLLSFTTSLNVCNHALTITLACLPLNIATILCIQISSVATRKSDQSC